MLSRAEAERRSNQRIDVLIHSAAMTGLCPICGERPSLYLTCGDERCVRTFLFPMSRRKEKQAQSEEQEEVTE